MNQLIFILCLLFSVAAQGAAPVLPAAGTLVPVTTGVAPLCIVGNASGVTQAGNSNPFHTLSYLWLFGDNAPGNFTTGAVRASKNMALGPVAAHCYMTPGTYSLRVYVTDGTNQDSDTIAITVTNPDTVFSGTNTRCVSMNSTPTAGSGGCPAGAEVTQQATWPTVTGYLASGKRVLLKGGDVWDVTASGTVAELTTAIWGSYGTANNGRAIVRVNASTPPSNSRIITGNATGWTGLRIKDIEFDGNGQTTALVNMAGGAVTNFAAVNNHIHQIGNAWNLTNSGNSGVIFLGETITGLASSSGGHAYGVAGSNVAIIGAYLDDFSGAEHPIRISGGTGILISNSTVKGAPDGTQNGDQGSKETIALRANVSGAVALTYAVVTTNHIDINGYAGVTISSGTLEPLNRDVIIDRNLIVSAGGATGFQNNAQFVSVRNNIFDMTLDDVVLTTGFIRLNDTDDGQNSENIWIYNNTFFSAASGGGAYGVTVMGGATDIIIRNNLQYTPNVGATNQFLSDLSGTATHSNNTGDIGSVTTNPFLTAPSLNNLNSFQPSTVYADDGGTAAFPATAIDILGCGPIVAKKGTYPIGAMRKRSDAICAGAP